MFEFDLINAVLYFLSILSFFSMVASMIMRKQQYERMKPSFKIINRLPEFKRGFGLVINAGGPMYMSQERLFEISDLVNKSTFRRINGVMLYVEIKATDSTGYNSHVLKVYREDLGKLEELILSIVKMIGLPQLTRVVEKFAKQFLSTGRIHIHVFDMVSETTHTYLLSNGETRDFKQAIDNAIGSYHVAEHFEFGVFVDTASVRITLPGGSKLRFQEKTLGDLLYILQNEGEMFFEEGVTYLRWNSQVTIKHIGDMVLFAIRLKGDEVGLGYALVDIGQSDLNALEIIHQISVNNANSVPIK